MNEKPPSADTLAGDILAGLASGDTARAWRRFVMEYSALIFAIARRYDADEPRASDCYLYVCEKLSDDSFARLRKFDADGKARFSTWLTAVVGNLCIDWRRQQYGRHRPSRLIARLPGLEQRVFHCLFEHGMTRHECLETLSIDFPDLTEQAVADINARIHALLSSRQRWQILARRRVMVSVDAQEGGSGALPAPDDLPGGTEGLTRKRQDLERLAAAMKELDAAERLILKLRYEEELTLAEIARSMGLGDPFRARRKIEAATAKLAQYMKL